MSVLVKEQVGQPSVLDVDVERVREVFTRNLQGHLTYAPVNFEQTGSVSAGKGAVRPAKCIGCGRKACKRRIHSEPPRSPDLCPCEFFI